MLKSMLRIFSPLFAIAQSLKGRISSAVHVYIRLGAGAEVLGQILTDR